MIKKSKNKKKCNCFDQGGFLGGYSMPFSGALGYSLAMDDMLRKDRKAQNTDTMKTSSVDAGVSPALFAYGGLLKENPTLFAIGGDMQTNGADFSDGMVSINAGGSHSENPYDGVQVGVDSENVPNLVEEGETIFNDYVYSKRIFADAETLKRFHLPKKAKLTYADISKKLEKEIKERPNDPISKASFKAQMEQLADEQERQKQEMAAERAKEAFEALSPEEQTALMQQKAQQDAMAEQAAQEQVMAEQQAMQQPTPEEMAMAQGQMSPEEIAMAQQQADSSQTMIAQPQAMAAYGGKIHRFDDGGTLKKKLYSLLGRATDSDFKKWLEEMGEGKLDYEAISKAVNEGDWETLRKNEGFIKALGKENRGLAHSISLGNNFGTFTPNASGYDLAAFNEKLGQYTKSKEQGNTKGNYKIDKEFVLGDHKTIKDLEDSKEYQDYTKALQDAVTRAKGIRWRYKDKNGSGYDNIEFQDGKSLSREDYELLNTLHNTVRGTSTKDKGEPVPVFTDADAEGWQGLADNASNIIDRLRNDQKGGIFHLNPGKLTRGQQAQNYLINDDGTVELITGTTEGLTPAGTHAWQDEKNDMTVNYYTRPATRAAEKPAAKDGEPAEVAPGLKPKYMKESNIGMWGPAVGLGLQLAGVGKPDTSGIDAAIASANQPAHLADYQPIGDYLTYRPLDIWFEQNALNAQARATDRALANTISPSKAAGILANGYNSQLASGNLFRQAQEYNDALRKQVGEFNRGTNQFNAEAYNRTSQFNADALNRAKQYSAQLALQGAAQKMDADAGWYNSLYGNIGGLFNNIKQWEKYKRDHNTLADMWASGIVPISGKTPAASKYVEAVGDAEGGKVRRKKSKRRGLTI